MCFVIHNYVCYVNTVYSIDIIAFVGYDLVKLIVLLFQYASLLSKDKIVQFFEPFS